MQMVEFFLSGPSIAVITYRKDLTFVSNLLEGLKTSHSQDVLLYRMFVGQNWLSQVNIQEIPQILDVPVEETSINYRCFVTTLNCHTRQHVRFITSSEITSQILLSTFRPRIALFFGRLMPFQSFSTSSSRSGTVGGKSI